MFLQALGENIILAKSLIEAIAVFAMSLGPKYASSGFLLRETLLPLCGRLGDPCQAVQASAEISVKTLCSACNYSGLKELIEQNIDYIVDGMCTQLREIDRFPRLTPQILCIKFKICMSSKN